MKLGHLIHSEAGTGWQSRIAWRGWRYLGAILAVVLWLAVAVMLYGNAFVRTRMEGALNAQLKGYTVALPRLDLNLFGFSVTLRDVTVTQDAHPKPAIARLAALQAGIDWRALLRAELVATFYFDEPELYINLAHFRAEVSDKTNLSERGWQQAAKEVYPLEINRIVVRNGTVTYIDDDPKRPMQIERLYMTLTNIRNVYATDEPYPSSIHLEAALFDTGRVQLSGNANFLAEPFAAIDSDFRLQQVPLAAIRPVAEHVNLKLAGGLLSAEGHVEYAPKKQDVEIRGVSSRAEPPPASLMLKGRFMGAGTGVVSSQFRTVNKKPEFSLTVQIEDTPLTAMNDLFRAYGNFDVVAGEFSFYSELQTRDGRIDG